MSPCEGNQEIRIIEEEVDRLNDLAERIGDFLRKPVGHPQCLNVLEEIRFLVPRFPGIKIQFTKSDSLWFVRIDLSRFRSVLENIIRNALESGSPVEEIQVALKPGLQHLKIHVKDRGSGLPAEGGKRLYDPFFTTKSTGTGLGLSISQTFLGAAGGKLTLQNREGGGVEAVITLPLENNHEDTDR